MRTEIFQLRDNDIPTTDGIEVEEYDIDEIEVLPPADPRLEGLSAATRGVINDIFGGDVDQAIYAANVRINTFARPPSWASELHGARSGWKDYNRARC